MQKDTALQVELVRSEKVDEKLQTANDNFMHNISIMVQIVTQNQSSLKNFLQFGDLLKCNKPLFMTILEMLFRLQFSSLVLQQNKNRKQKNSK